MSAASLKQLFMERDYEDEFYLITEHGQVYLKIMEVFGFPSETSFLGGYDTRTLLDIKVGTYSGKAIIYISTGQLHKFLTELKACYQTLKGTASLKDYEGNLEMVFDFDGLGHVKVSGHLREDISNRTELRFELDTDQTRIPQMIHGLEDLVLVYGDEKGASTQ